MTDLAQFVFIDPDDVVLQTRDKKSRRAISNTDLPPLVLLTKELIQQALAQGLGPMGEAAVVKVFDAESIRDCQEGIFWINYDGERFEYETPIPGR